MIYDAKAYEAGYDFDTQTTSNARKNAIDEYCHNIIKEYVYIGDWDEKRFLEERDQDHTLITDWESKGYKCSYCGSEHNVCFWKNNKYHDCIPVCNRCVRLDI